LENILITGVSTGIGYSCLKAFIKRGDRVFGSVRKTSDAEKLKQEFGDNFIPLIFDVTDQDAIDKSYFEVEKNLNGQGLDCLINNSGIAEGGPILHIDIEKIKKHFDINVIGLFRVTKKFLPLLGARKNHNYNPGRIINITSVAGKISAPMIAPYSGSKHAVEGMSHSLRRELLLYGIKVIIAAPGAVITPIWDKGIDEEPFLNTDYGESIKLFAKQARKKSQNGFTADKVANDIVKIFESKNPKVRYAIVPGYITNWLIPRLLPHKVIDFAIGKAMKLIK
jgi:short-subunit dehydrogenase